MSAPLVSIMMPAWNVEKYIGQAIESITDQTYQNWELCIVDDGSTDDTLAVIKQYARSDDRIKFTARRHSGCPATRNACLNMMSGILYARQDADDLSDRRRIQYQVEYLLEHTGKDIVTTKMYWLKNGRVIPQNSGAMEIGSYLEGSGGSPVNASIVAWRGVYDSIGNFDKTMPAGSDGDWNFRAIDKGMTWGFLNEPLYIYRRHAGQITQRMRKEQRDSHERSRKNYQ